MKLLHCTHCGQRVFFENVRCENCGAALGYVPAERSMVGFLIEADGSWVRQDSEGPAQRPCQNYTDEQVCNWMVPADGNDTLCISCRTTHTIPALTKEANRTSWAALERAKRRLFYTLIDLGLPVPSKTDDAVNGLSFEFLEEVNPKQRVLTGHDAGVITLNIAEADDAHRERVRLSMHEPYRTLLGHFRHESGHYYWDRLVDNTPWLDEYRALFGDERADYSEALKKHYESPMADWAQHHISAYASSHPWEDWAECWAHYLHMIDGLDTAAAWGLRLEHAVPAGDELVAEPVDMRPPTIDTPLIEQWLPVSQFVNAMNRSLGLHDSYPFVVLPSVVAKLDFIHRVVSTARRGESPMNFTSAQPVAEVSDEALATAPSEPEAQPRPPEPAAAGTSAQPASAAPA